MIKVCIVLIVQNYVFHCLVMFDFYMKFFQDKEEKREKDIKKEEKKKEEKEAKKEKLRIGKDKKKTRSEADDAGN